MFGPKVLNATFSGAVCCLLLMVPHCHAASSTLPRVQLTDFQLNTMPNILNSVTGFYAGAIQLTYFEDSAGSAFLARPVLLGPTSSFSVEFKYEGAEGVTGSNIGDGFAFVVENTTAGAGYLGEDGSGLGFFTQTVSPALGVTFDYTFNGITGSAPGTIAIATPNGSDLVEAVPTEGLTGAARYVWIDYQNSSKVMEVFFSTTDVKPATPTLTTSLPQDLSTLLAGQMYVGFTGGTGSDSCNQLIQLVRFAAQQ